MNRVCVDCGQDRPVVDAGDGVAMTTTYHPIPSLTESVMARFFAKTLIQPNGCIDWTGSRSPDGYGRFMAKGPRPDYAHRVALAWAEGDRPDMTVDHLCRNRACVNPQHLEWVSMEENSRPMTRLVCTGPDWTDTDPVRRHLRALRAGGMRVEDIIADAGVSRTLVTDLLYGRAGEHRRRILARNATALLAVELRTDRAFLPPHGTRRRITALAALGWSFADQERVCGISRRRLTNMAQGRCGRTGVRPETAQRIAAMYDELSMQVGPSSYARTVANRYGWLPPLAWDDDTIDSPYAYAATDAPDRDEIDEIAVQRAVDGDPPERMTRAERAEASRRLTAAGYSAAQIAARLRVNPKSVERYRAAS